MTGTLGIGIVQVVYYYLLTLCWVLKSVDNNPLLVHMVMVM